jgi:hypothetical protein
VASGAVTSCVIPIRRVYPAGATDWDRRAPIPAHEPCPVRSAGVSNFRGVGEPIAEGDFVAARWDGGDTHTGPAFRALPVGSLPAASGRKMRFTGTTVFRI